MRYSVLATILVSLSATVLTTTAAAQPAPLTYGAPITLDAAKKVMAAAEAEAKKNNWTMVVSILDSGGNLVMMQRMDGTQYGSVLVAEEKARTALNFKRPTKAFQDVIAGGGDGLRILGLPGVTPVQGGILIVDGGKIIGAVGVSGAASDQDEQVAMAGVKALAK